MKVINLLGAPGAGKSTLRAQLFAQMKIAGYKVEEITEYAKDVVWEERHNIFEKDQLYILAKQHRRLVRLAGKVDYVVTDCPLILNLAYQNPNLLYSETLAKLTLELFIDYDNANFFINRTHDYQDYGRNQNEEEADILSVGIKSIMRVNNIGFIEVDSDKFSLDIVKPYL